MRIVPPCLIFLAILAASGCSASLPLSETYIFSKDGSTRQPRYGNPDTLTWTSSSSGVVSFNNNAAGIEHYLVEDHNATSYSNLQKIAVAYSSAHNVDFMALGYNIGYNTLGVNSTFGVGLGNYLTLNGSFLAGEAILQRKIITLSTPDLQGGITLGAFAKRDYFSYNKDPESTIDVYLDIFQFREWTPIDVYGARSMFHFRIMFDATIHGFASYGYSPQLDDGLVNVGFAFGMDHFK